MTLSQLVREPLLHFVVFGALLFGLHAAFAAKPNAKTETNRIVVDGVHEREIAARFAEAQGRPPSNEELDREIEKWVEEEVLYREGVARGLERDDPGVRQRVASKMAYVLDAKLELPEPTPAELERWFAAHRDRFRVPVRV